MGRIYKFIAFGGGQCSSVLPFILKDYNHIIFCDTGQELEFTYAWCRLVQKSFPDKFIWLDTKDKFVKCHPPLCTKEAKILPSRRYVAKYLKDNKLSKKAIKYLGITIEESRRMSKSDVKWVQIERPLVELRWTRRDCCNFLLNKIGLVPPRSGCISCRSFDRNHLIEGFQEFVKQSPLDRFNFK